MTLVCCFFQEGIPSSVPTSELAARQVSRKRLLLVPDNQPVEVEASTVIHNDEREEESLNSSKRSKIDAASSKIGLINEKEETLLTDLNSNVQVAGDESTGRPYSETSPVTSSAIKDEPAGVLKCPAHYDAEVWDALPRELQWEILNEAAPAEASPASTRAKSISTPAKGSFDARKASKSTRSKKKTPDTKNSILKYFSKS
jgi:hypothetical protein